VYEKRVLRRIYGHKRDEVVGGWIKLYYEELHNLYSSPNEDDQIKEDEMVGHVTGIAEMRNCMNTLTAMFLKTTVHL
jgi:hypothetical protein